MEHMSAHEPDDYTVESFVFDGEIVDDSTMQQLFDEIDELGDSTLDDGEGISVGAVEVTILAWRHRILENPQAPDWLKTVAKDAPDAVIQEYLEQMGIFDQSKKKPA